MLLVLMQKETKTIKTYVIHSLWGVSFRSRTSVTNVTNLINLRVRVATNVCISVWVLHITSTTIAVTFVTEREGK